MRLLSLIKRLGLYVEPEQREHFSKYLISESHRTEQMMGIGILVLQAIMMLLTLCKKGGVFATWQRTSYFSLYAALFTVTLISLVVFAMLLKKQLIAGCHITRILYAMAVCIWACAITFLDQCGGNGLSVYAYIILSVAAIMVIPPFWSVLLFVGISVFLNILLLFTPNAMTYLFSNAVNSGSVTILSLFISIRMYQRRVKGYHDGKLIEQQWEQIEARNRQLSYLVHTDSVTHMNNRRYLDEVMPEIFEINRAKDQIVAGLMLDLDFFKQYNDNYGHQEGDLCLSTLGEEIKRHTENKNAYAARYGGEEFFVCLFETSRERALELAEQLRRGIATSDLKRDDLPSGHVTVSIGVSVKRMHKGLAFETLIREADEALYCAKELGRDQVICFE